MSWVLRLWLLKDYTNDFMGILQKNQSFLSNFITILSVNIFTTTVIDLKKNDLSVVGKYW